MSERIECMFCGSTTAEIGDKHFCQFFNCPLYMKPQEWFVELNCVDCAEAAECPNKNKCGCVELKQEEEHE